MIKLAALLGHRKAKLLVTGQKQTVAFLKEKKNQQTIWKNCIWFHASSVGEFEQARPIIEKLKAKKPQTKILLTFFSPSGYELHKGYPMADKVLYLPFATQRNARLFLDVLRPSMAIFVKYEFWPAYLRELSKRAVPTYLISGIFNSKQLFFKPWGLSYRRLLTLFTRLYVQDEASKQLLAKYRINNTVVAGDTRFDRVVAVSQNGKETPIVERFINARSNEFQLPTDKIIVAGSTWQKDEQLFARYLNEHEDVKLILAPHEIDKNHLHTIFQLFKGRYVRFTEATPTNVLHVQTLVIDTVGMLSTIYRYGHVAYIGGGFGVGIHNTLEPAVYGMPILFGPNYKQFREAKGLIGMGAATSVKNYEEFAAAMDKALANYTELGLKAKQYVASELGASDKIYNDLFG